jgi:DNA-binding NtrC family response regulator
MLDVLLVDDDDNVRESVAVALLGAGHKVTEACDGAEALDLLACHAFDLAICDVQMPRLDGLTLFRRLRRDAPGTAVIIMTSHGKIPDVVDTLRDGASDYVTKPFDPDEFTQRVVAPIAEHRALRMRFEAARAQLVARDTGACLVAVSPAMRALEGRMALLSQSDASLVITGDRGTGKELVARTLHAQGPRRGGPLVLVDGALLPELLRASELAESGVRDPPAETWLREAEGGTLVLRGLEGLPIREQAALVRLISNPHAIARRAGDGSPLGTRVITLGREPLAARSERGDLLESLYYRLNGTTLHVPRLVDRAEDLCPLVTRLLEELQPPTLTLPGLTPEAWKALSGYTYPGNVRELRWILEHALAMSDGGPIDVSHLPAECSYEGGPSRSGRYPVVTRAPGR